MQHIRGIYDVSFCNSVNRDRWIVYVYDRMYAIVGHNSCSCYLLNIPYGLIIIIVSASSKDSFPASPASPRFSSILPDYLLVCCFWILEDLPPYHFFVYHPSHLKDDEQASLWEASWTPFFALETIGRHCDGRNGRCQLWKLAFRIQTDTERKRNWRHEAQWRQKQSFARW